MKRLLLLLLLFSSISCKDNLDGTCDSPLVIKVDKPIVEGAERIFFVSVKKNNGWWVSSISANGREVDLADKPLKDAFVIENDGFVFEKINNSAIKVTFNESQSEEPIKLNIMLQAGNCFSGFELPDAPRTENRDSRL